MSRRIRYAKYQPDGGWLRQVIDSEQRVPLVCIEVDYDADREAILTALGDAAAAIIEDRELSTHPSL